MIEAALAATGVPATRSAMIGDTSYDMVMARAAGSLAVGVAWGYHLEVELREAGAEAIAHSPADLLPILDAIA